MGLCSVRAVRPGTTCAAANALIRLADGGIHRDEGRPPTLDPFLGAGVPGLGPRPARCSPRRRTLASGRARTRAAGPLGSGAARGRRGPGRRVPPRRAGRGARRSRSAPSRSAATRSSTPTCARSSRRPGARCGRALAARLTAAQLADHPATEVTLADALAFCAWASARACRPGAEWEAAARGDGRARRGRGATRSTPTAATAPRPAGAGPCRSAPTRRAPRRAAPSSSPATSGSGSPTRPTTTAGASCAAARYLDTRTGLRAARALPADPDARDRAPRAFAS